MGRGHRSRAELCWGGLSCPLCGRADTNVGRWTLLLAGKGSRRSEGKGWYAERRAGTDCRRLYCPSSCCPAAAAHLPTAQPKLKRLVSQAGVLDALGLVVLRGVALAATGARHWFIGEKAWSARVRAGGHAIHPVRFASTSHSPATASPLYSPPSAPHRYRPALAGCPGRRCMAGCVGTAGRGAGLLAYGAGHKHGTLGSHPSCPCQLSVPILRYILHQQPTSCPHKVAGCQGRPLLQAKRCCCSRKAGQSPSPPWLLAIGTVLHAAAHRNCRFIYCRPSAACSLLRNCGHRPAVGSQENRHRKL